MASCSFCQKPDTEVRFLIAGLDDALICNECAAGARDVLAESAAEEAKAGAPAAPRAKVLRMSDFYPEAAGTFACPVCGLETPHNHEYAEV